MMNIRIVILALVALFAGLVGGFLLGWWFGQSGNNEFNTAREQRDASAGVATLAASSADTAIVANRQLREQLAELNALLAVPLKRADGGMIERPDDAVAYRAEQAESEWVARCQAIQEIDQWLRGRDDKLGLAQRTPAELGLTPEQFDTMKRALGEK